MVVFLIGNAVSYLNYASTIEQLQPEEQAGVGPVCTCWSVSRGGAFCLVTGISVRGSCLGAQRHRDQSVLGVGREVARTQHRHAGFYVCDRHDFPLGDCTGFPPRCQADRLGDPRSRWSLERRVLHHAQPQQGAADVRRREPKGRFLWSSIFPPSAEKYRRSPGREVVGLARAS